jgi:hypothetical protein
MHTSGLIDMTLRRLPYILITIGELLCPMVIASKVAPYFDAFVKTRTQGDSGFSCMPGFLETSVTPTWTFSVSGNTLTLRFHYSSRSTLRVPVTWKHGNESSELGVLTLPLNHRTHHGKDGSHIFADVHGFVHAF